MITRPGPISVLYRNVCSFPFPYNRNSSAKRSVSRRLIRPWFEGHERQWGGRSFREGTQILCGSILGPQFSLETRSEIFELSNRPPRAAILLAVAIRNLRNRYSNLNTNFSFLSIYDLSISFILYEKKNMNKLSNKSD